MKPTTVLKITSMVNIWLRLSDEMSNMLWPHDLLDQFWSKVATMNSCYREGHWALEFFSSGPIPCNCMTIFIAIYWAPDISTTPCIKSILQLNWRVNKFKCSYYIWGSLINMNCNIIQCVSCYHHILVLVV